MLVLRVNLKSRRIFMSELSIGEVARRTGVKPSALRYYEQEGLLPRASRTGGRRRYGERDVRMVELLRFAQQAGFTLDEIKKLFHRFDAKAPFHICRQIVCIETYQWAITLTNQCSGHIAGGAARRSVKILDIPLSARSAPISPVRSAGTRRPTCGPESAARVFRPHDRIPD